MGTPEFAVASLEALLKAGEQIVAVVTAPDKPAGRGQKLQESAVKQYALSQNLPILQPVKLKDETFLEELASYEADLQVVVAFRMLPEVVWDMPPMGTINLHASLLPQYRGAAPINHAIINGERESGVSTFFLQQEIDTGNLLFREVVRIGPSDTAGELHDELMQVGAALLVKTVQAISEGEVEPIPQKELITGTPLKHAPKIFKKDCQIIWNRTVKEIHNHIRGLSPYPTAYTELGGKSLKVYKSLPEKGNVTHKPGEYDTDGKTYLKFAGTDGYVQLLEVQQEGKKRILIDEFLRGYRF